jgi:membrane fusion protein (multidrug efflux system)
MTTTFGRSFARILADRGRLTGAINAAATCALAGWCWWAASADVTLYEASTNARVELDQSTYPIQSPMDGRVVAVNLHVGQHVRQGDVLVELDSMPASLELQEQQTRAQGLTPEIQRLNAEIAAEEVARGREREAARLHVDEASSRTREAQAESAYADAELGRIQRLHAQGLVSDRDLEKTKADAAQRAAAVAALQSAERQVRQDQSTRDGERDVRIAGLRTRIAALEAARATAGAGLGRLGYELQRHQVRANVDGTIAESAMLRPGAVLHQGDALASVVPASGRLIVAAQFPADRAIGRLRPGQPAAFRVDAFPWAEFGSVAATVSRVAQEVRDGNVRVELTVDPESTFRGTIAHGMPGSLDVIVEHATPLALVLRAAGRTLTRPQ